MYIIFENSRYDNRRQYQREIRKRKNHSRREYREARTRGTTGQTDINDFQSWYRPTARVLIRNTRLGVSIDITEMERRNHRRKTKIKYTHSRI